MVAKKRIVNRYTELLAIKERKERRTYSNRQVAEILGVAKNTVDSYARNEITRYDEHVVLGFCDFLGCSLHEFLVIEQVEATPEMKTPLFSVA